MLKEQHSLVRLPGNGAIRMATGPGRFDLQRGRYEDGGVAIMFTGALLVILGLLGLSLDLARAYNRRVEMQNVADAAVLAAARELDGTSAGVARAINRAERAAERLTYNYSQSTTTWSADAITFSATRTGEWVDSGTASANPNGMRYVRVDTSKLLPEHNAVETIFIKGSGGAAVISAGGRAIAGPSSINVVPFAICAMSPLAAEPRANPGSSVPTYSPPNVELVEYGFRRGVSYDLMQLNPNATTAVNFIVNPLAPPNTTGSAADMNVATVGPFVCAGTMAMPRVTGGTITVAQGFPIGTLFNAFNSRFDTYLGGACNPVSAPPDANVRAYDRDVAGNVAWMSPLPATQAPDLSTANNKRRTIADLVPNGAGSYGVLWSYARAVPFSSYVAGAPEPAAGYTPFPTTAWSTLYDPGRPAAPGYPATGKPYSATLGANFLAPVLARRPGVRDRRVLNVPLLQCPVNGSSATVLGIGRFFMTVPATGTALVAEFAGIASEQSLGTQVELQP